MADKNETLEKNSGRIETRVCSVIRDLDLLDEKENWCGIKTIVKIDATREIGYHTKPLTR